MRFYSWHPDSTVNASIAKIRVPGLFVEGNLSDRTEYNPAPFAEWEWHPEATAYWDAEDGRLTDLPFSLVHIHSPRLKALIEQLGLAEEVQYLPIWVRSLQSGELVGQYYVAHFLRRVACLDWEHSNIEGLWAVCRREAMAPWRLFRMREYPNFVIVREDVKRAIQRARITGCSFELRKMV